MKRLIFTLSFIIYHLSFSAAPPFSAAPNLPSWTKKATKAVFTLKTFRADGTLLASTNGFFTSESGEAQSTFTPFKGAATAVVIDAQGKEMPVECMLGADDTYDVARFRVAAKKVACLTVTPQAANEGNTVWLLPYCTASQKQSTALQGAVRKTETFRDHYAYYTVAIAGTDDLTGCPLLNEAGEAIGLMQQPARQDDSLRYAVSTLFADSLRITGLSINDATLRATAIKKDLPQQLDQALLTLYVAQASLDSASYATLVDDFIVRFPIAPDGYVYRAQLATNGRRFADAARDMEQAISVADKKDEAHFSYSKIIYEKEIYMADTPYDGWSLDKALSEAREAEKINPAPIYRHQQATILYAQKQYEEAYQLYAALFPTELRSADLFFEASRCKLAQADTTAMLALLDSCVATFSKPYLKEAAPYILARAQARMNAKRYRDAVSDFNDYETLMQASVNDRFYYLRHQADLGGRLFQQALNDIDRAIAMNPDYDLYYAEKASLQIRVGQYDEAAATAREGIRLAPDHSDGYLFLGLAQCLKGEKGEGVKNLQKALELGDTQAAALIEKYK